MSDWKYVFGKVIGFLHVDENDDDDLMVVQVQSIDGDLVRAPLPMLVLRWTGNDFTIERRSGINIEEDDPVMVGDMISFATSNGEQIFYAEVRGS